MGVSSAPEAGGPVVLDGLSGLPMKALPARHAPLVRVTHWVNVIACAALLVSGYGILIAHPRLYWGETGHFGEPALVVLPVALDEEQTAWARGLHFLAGWVAVVNGLAYVVGGWRSRHFRRDLAPTRSELAPRHLAREVAEHARLRRTTGEPLLRYNVLQKIAYLAVVFAVAPLTLVSGLAMSPGIVAAVPQLTMVFGGHQSGRTVHFVAATLLVVFLAVHLFQVWLSGPARQMRAMTTGGHILSRKGE